MDYAFTLNKADDIKVSRRMFAIKAELNLSATVIDYKVTPNSDGNRVISLTVPNISERASEACSQFCYLWHRASDHGKFSPPYTHRFDP